MNTRAFVKWLAVLLGSAALATPSVVCAQSGYMAFLDTATNQPTTVKTGDAASYMRAGNDWDQSTCSPGGVGTCSNPGSVATPTLLQSSTITTSRDGSGLHFKFVIPDRTTTKYNQGGSELACGDQIVVQIGKPTDAQLTAGNEFRFDVVLQVNSTTGTPVVLAKHVPNSIGRWSPGNALTTSTAMLLSSAGNQYTLTLDIPLSDVGSPTSDIALALAIIDDLGFPGIQSQPNQATGTAFPVGMGLTPESDPGLTCGGQPAGDTASNNWLHPNTWGIGYFLRAPSGSVTLSQSPNPYLSDAIRIGKCDVTNFADMPAVTANNWMADQQNSPTWYVYYPNGPCQMGIWVNANLSGTGVVKRRFLVVWGRPGISPVDWYFAGLTDPVALSPGNTPISFLWNNVPAVTFSDHPCLRVYVLPETIDPTNDQPFIDALKNTATSTETALENMESHFVVAFPGSQSAQMNFDNIDNTPPATCPSASHCGPQIGLGSGPDVRVWPRFSSVQNALASYYAPNAVAIALTGGQQTHGGEVTHVGGPNLVRIFLHSFAVAPPQNKKPYVYVEPIGGLGWAIPATVLANGVMPLNMDVAIPKVAAKVFVDGHPIEVLSSPSRVYFGAVTDALPGTTVPKIDLSSLAKFSESLMTPGVVTKAQISASPGGGTGGTGGICSKLRGGSMFVLPMGAVLIGAVLYWPRKKKRNENEPTKDR